MPQPLKVLIVEDNPADAELVLLELQNAGFEPDWLRVETEAAYLENLRGGLDLVLSDFSMPQFNGLRALELLQQSGLDVPFILVSGTIGEDTAVAAMRLGAADYLMKDRLPRLGAAVTHALAETKLRVERRSADEALRIAHAQLSQLLEHSPAVLYALKVEGEKVRPYLFSENVTRLLGFPVAETLSYDWWLGQLHPEDRQRAQASIAETLARDTSRTEYRLRHKDGSYHWVDDNRRLVRNAAGEPAELIGVWDDIEERKQAEEVFKQRTAELERFHRLSVGRELRMIELKREVNELAKLAGRTAPYDLSPPEQGAIKVGGDAGGV